MKRYGIRVTEIKINKRKGKYVAVVRNIISKKIENCISVQLVINNLKIRRDLKNIVKNMPNGKQWQKAIIDNQL